MKPDAAELIVVGRIAGVHGVKGLVKVQSYTRPMDNLLNFGSWMVAGLEYELRQGSLHGPGLLAQLDGVGDRDAAAALVGQDIRIQRQQLPPLADGEIYWADLIGMQVLGLEAEALGTVSGLMETGAHDVLVVARDGKEFMIPYVHGPIVTEVDVPRRQIQVNWAASYWD